MRAFVFVLLVVCACISAIPTQTATNLIQQAQKLEEEETNVVVGGTSISVPGWPFFASNPADMKAKVKKTTMDIRRDLTQYQDHPEYAFASDAVSFVVDLVSTSLTARFQTVIRNLMTSVTEGKARNYLYSQSVVEVADILNTKGRGFSHDLCTDHQAATAFEQSIKEYKQREMALIKKALEADKTAPNSAYRAITDLETEMEDFASQVLTDEHNVLQNVAQQHFLDLQHSSVRMGSAMVSFEFLRRAVLYAHFKPVNHVEDGTLYASLQVLSAQEVDDCRSQVGRALRAKIVNIWEEPSLAEQFTMIANLLKDIVAAAKVDDEDSEALVAGDDLLPDLVKYMKCAPNADLATTKKIFEIVLLMDQTSGEEAYSATTFATAIGALMQANNIVV
eukprot:c15160_g1_i1.p1 GENE.c15160_g1_i1~~c15160_g1_i1.p1  ORF type:complete len:393 (-),score=111.44 c15160_g1_i1:54-1232(-)